MTRKLFIIPDVHGRCFWKSVKDRVKSDPSCTIVFLGDYLDPYFPEGIDFQKALENFKEIIAFKKENPDAVVLLVGNHDIHYIDGDYGCSRFNRTFAKEAKKLFNDNRDLFQLAYLWKGEKKQVLCTHAGISQGWIRANMLEKWFDTPEHASQYLNEALLNTDNRPVVGSCINGVGFSRGGHLPEGGPLWCDVKEWKSVESWKDTIQVFGHTQQLYTGYIKVAGDGQGFCCDSRKAFEYNEDEKKLVPIE